MNRNLIKAGTTTIMTLCIKPRILLIGTLWLSILLTGCDDANLAQNKPTENAHGEAVEVEPAKGPHRGRLLVDKDFTLELALFETGVPPEFRAWATDKGQVLKPDTVDLNITLTRLGDKIEQIKFKPHGDALRGDMVIYEPHSFIVTINASYDGTPHTWQYDSFEGRTKIAATVAKALKITTSIAGPAVLQETITVYGQVIQNTEQVSNVSARFDGLIKSVKPSLGEKVKKGQRLATVESDESLKRYKITAPISGIITLRDANPGEQTNGRQLFTITDTSSVWVDLSLFPMDQARVHVGAHVKVFDTISGLSTQEKITRINVNVETNQTVKARIVLNNEAGKLLPGSYVTAKINVAKHPVSLAVKRTGLQTYRDFTVVYAQIGEEYEVRMLELGRQFGQWAEVLSGLEPGTRYVSGNSYIIKADIEKSGASHDH